MRSPRLEGLPGFLILAPFIFLLFVLLAASPLQVHSQQTGEVQEISEAVVVKVRGTVDQGLKRYIQVVLENAQNRGAALILDVQSPGGFLGDTMDIADMIFNARVPVIGFASGDSFSGATLILVPTHVLAVSPTALVGDAQPVTIDQTGRVVPITEPKIVNPLLKKFQDYASQRGRNATLVGLFITNATVVNGIEAVKLGFADLNAVDLQDLVSKLRGRKVSVMGREYVLNIVSTSYSGQCISCSILSFLSDPTVSGVMMTIGVLGSIFALASGHLIALPPAIVFLILGLIGSGLQVDLLALAMVAIGAVLIASGIAIGHSDGGILMGSGIALLAIGAALSPVAGREILIAGSSGVLTTIFYFSIGIGLGSAAVAGLVAWQLVVMRKKRSEMFEILGKEGLAKDEISPGKEGFVMVEGELWKAVSDETIKPGDPVEVVGKKGFTLIVRRKRAQRSL